MSQPQRTTSQDSTTDGMRKRVCKACDRCRLKKSKCDGSHPCSRCKADNAICVFGERKKSHDKVYPKGYVEMLEQQQAQLVCGLQETYRRLLSAQAWTGPALAESNGQPLTHDILAALGLLDSRGDGSSEVEVFEEDCQKLQSKLLAEGAGYMNIQRRGSFSSDSDHSQHGPSRAMSNTTPIISNAPGFRESFNFSVPPSPLPQSPQQIQQQRPTFHRAQPSPLQSSPLHNDPQLFQSEWAIPDMSTPAAIMRSRFAMQTPSLQMGPGDEQIYNNNAYNEQMIDYDTPLDGISMMGYPGLPGGAFGDGMQNLDFTTPLDPMELDFAKYISVQT